MPFKKHTHVFQTKCDQEYAGSHKYK